MGIPSKCISQSLIQHLVQLRKLRLFPCLSLEKALYTFHLMPHMIIIGPSVTFYYTQLMIQCCMKP